MELIPKLAEATKNSLEEVVQKLNGLTVSSTIQENHGQGVHIAMSDYERLEATYERLYERVLTEKDQRLAEKDRHIATLEEQLHHARIC